ncbi:MAG TPA: MBL fold metallo-hydrolase [Burkholderiales bacterium]|nr:MBL fold metallo-hydrolase [Burkholderiales bacterium]
MRLTFLGAAGEVTGSAFLVEADSARFLVDCGLFQGGRDANAKNRARFACRPAALDFVIATHAHLDHCGLIPRLVASGYGRSIHATAATADLLPVMLRDSAYIQEKEAAWRQKRADRGRQHRGEGEHNAEPLYTVADVEHACGLVAAHPYDAEFRPRPGVRARFRDAGHILGAAITELWVRDGGRETKLVFSGDLGRPARPLVRDPTPIDAANVLVVESTYGNRNHRSIEATVDELVAVAADTFERRRGNVIVPAFALGRTQELIVLLGELAADGRLPRLSVFVDSPLASAATEVTLKHANLLDERARRVLRGTLEGTLPLKIRFTENAEDSKAINAIRSGALVIAASGMCDAGRIKHHLEHNLARAECAVLFTGYQAQGTLGRRIVDGARSVRLFDAEVQVRASIHTLGGLSAHADQQGLLGWLAQFESPPHRTFVVHGEEEVATLFAELVAEKLKWNAHAPARGATVEL